MIEKTSKKRRCGYKTNPEDCAMYMDWVELIDMEYLEKSKLTGVPKVSQGHSGGRMQ